MGLQVQTTTPHGFVLNDAYYRIREVFHSQTAKQVGMQLEMWKDYESRLDPNIEPISVKPYEVKNDEQQQKEAIYRFAVDNGPGSNLKIGFSEGNWLAELIEGEDFTAGDMQSIVDALNDTETFAEGFVASIQSDGVESIQITAKNDGEYSGAKGNGLIITGTLVRGPVRVERGRDYKPSTYDQFFSVEIFEESGTNLYRQCYLYLKTLPEFTGAIDVL